MPGELHRCESCGFETWSDTEWEEHLQEELDALSAKMEDMVAEEIRPAEEPAQPPPSADDEQATQVGITTVDGDAYTYRAPGLDFAEAPEGKLLPPDLNGLAVLLQQSMSTPKPLGLEEIALRLTQIASEGAMTAEHVVEMYLRVQSILKAKLRERERIREARNAG